MTVAEHLGELLHRWQELRRQGRDVPIEELCPGQPELAAELAAQIRLLQQNVGTPPPRTAGDDTGPDGGSAVPPIPSLTVSGRRYELLGELGRGGFGVVYRARDSRTGRIVALKTMRRQDGTSLEFFKREFRYLQGVSHPNLAQLYELESDGQEWLLTMELVEGVNFLTYVRPAAPVPRLETPLPTAAEEVSLASGDHTPEPQVPLATNTATKAERLLPPLQLDRLREAMGQLAEGIAALHAHQRVHRDLKPHNVRVTAEGRVVVLDFGLATDLGPTGKHLHTDQVLLGTFPYMAPEMGQTPPVSSPASDWYSVGVMLYQALTGQLPFTGGVLQMMRDKLTRDPAAPRDLCPDVPADLNALCLALLQRQPENRPAAGEILERLARQPPVPPTGGDVGEQVPLLGRERHLRLLEEAYAASRQGGAVLVAVHGSSGIGKSALVRHFLDGLRGRGAVVLAGRCYEHESVPYKALDPLVDELGHYLRGLQPHEVEARLPRDVGPLTRVFPVLGRVEAVAEAAARSTLSPDPHEVRRRAFAGLREVLARVGDRQPLVLYIDDLQWGDVDSAHLLTDLLQPPDPPALLLVISYRSEDADSPCLRTLAEALGKGQAIDRRELAVAPLTEGETCDLVLQLLGSGAERRAAEIFRESGGNPFFVTELVQESQSGAERGESGLAQGELTLEGLIRTRVQRLPAGAQRLLEVVAVSGRPVGEAEACRAAGAGADARTLLARLESGKFVRGTQLAEESRLETYHDRIRETVAAALKPDVLRDYHGRLAQALEESGRGDPEEVAGHFEGAGERARAGSYYARAAERALETLAFDQAANLYRRSLELRPVEGAEGRKLRTQLGDALANAGRGAEAGPIYFALAEEAEALEKLELWRRSAVQFLVSGQKEEGLAVLRTLLNRVGLDLPAGRRRALFALMLEMLWIRLRGLNFRERAVESIPAEELLRVDACGAAYRGVLCFTDALVPTLFHARHLRLALRSGEAVRIAQGLALESGLSAWAGRAGRARAEGVMVKAKSLAERLNQPLLLPCTTLMEGLVAWGLGRFKECVAKCELAEELAGQMQVNFADERTKLRHFILDSLFMMGEWRGMSHRLPAWRADARQRCDRFSGCFMWVHSYVPCLAADRPDEAEEFIRQAVEEWIPGGGFGASYWALYGQVESALYRGDRRRARELVLRQWSFIKDINGADFVQFLLLLLVHLRARTALATAAATPAGGWLFCPQARLLRAAARDARKIARGGMPWSNPLAKLIRAGIANLRGKGADAVSLLDTAEKEFLAADMGLYAAATRRQRGRLVGGEDGKTLRTSADTFMASQDIRNPARIAAMLVPGFPD